MKRLIYTLFTLIILGIVISCERDETISMEKYVPEGYIPVNFTFKAPNMSNVETKAVDPDGKGVNSMILFCFDNFGMYIGYVEVKESEITHPGASYPYLTGTVEDTPIPENTRRIHFVANQNAGSFNENDFKGKSEREVISQLEGSSGMMIYWGYYAPDGISVTDSEAFKEALEKDHGTEGTPLRLLRNQARFKVNVAAGNFAVSGFTVVNTNAFGTVAPYHPEKGFNFSRLLDNDGNWIACDWTDDDFITLPQDTRRLSPPIDVDIADETCVFETDNNSAHPVSIIIKGRNGSNGDELYYRVILMDTDGSFIKVRRNFNYTINIKGDLSYGQTSFEKALSAPASNNVWLSIDDDVNEVSDGQFSLSVKETAITILAKKNGENWELLKPASGADYELITNTDGYFEVLFGYNVRKLLDGSLNETSDKPVVSWIEGNNISSLGIENLFSIGTGGDTSSGEGEIGVVLDNLQGLDNENISEIEGTVLVKKGILQRKIKIRIMKEMAFTPVWVSTQVNKSVGENVTLLFTIPEECPDELLPFDVYVSVNHMDARNVSGRTFPIITKLTDPDNYGIDTYTHYSVTDGVYTPAAETPIGYKYVYTVTEKGDQRIYFTNLIDRTDENAQEFITIESPLFSTVHKPFTFNLTGDNRIELPFINYVEADSVAGMGDDEVKYILVPQKINHKVEFDFALTYLDKGTKKDTLKGNPDNEFLIYTENLSHKTGDHSCIWVFNEFNNGYSVTDNLTSGGRVMAFRFKGDTNATKKGERYIFPMYMYTTKAKNAEVIRISSNHPGSASAFSNDPSDKYNGNSFRSIIFELANYHPFHFDAKINDDGNSATGGTEEQIDNVTIPYDPSTNINISLNIREFTGADGKSVSPFGYPFPVFIIAPMLSKGNSGTTADKIKDGVFVYTINAEGTNANQTLTFSKNGIVSDGEILITTDPVLAGASDIVVEGSRPYEHQIVNFYNKTFRITSETITGTITKSGDVVTEPNMTEGAFVSFALTRNNSRIGSMKIHAPDSGHTNKAFRTSSWYELTLRPEYNFSWDEEIKITHTHGTGASTEVFIKESISLGDLYSNKNIVLTKQSISTP